MRGVWQRRSAAGELAMVHKRSFPVDGALVEAGIKVKVDVI